MQQTSQYKLNLIESGDTFSAAPLNENAEKLETALTGLSQGVAAGAKCAFGSYTGKGTSGVGHPSSLTFSFNPKFLLIWGNGAYDYCAMAIRGTPLRCFKAGSSGHRDFTTTWGTNQVSWYSGDGSSGTAYLQLEHSGATYFYLAIG